MKKFTWSWIKEKAKTEATALALVRLSKEMECEPSRYAAVEKIYDWLDEQLVSSEYRKMVRDLEVRYHNQKAMGLQGGLIDTRSSKIRGGCATIEVKVKKTTKAKLSMKSEVCEGKVLLTLPLQTKSEANCFEHWTKKHQRHKIQQRTVASALRPLRDKIKLPCKILLTRIAPNKLDKHDNLPMSFKYIVDACCAIITGNYIAGKADSDERISIAYDQVESKSYGVTIQISF